MSVPARSIRRKAGQRAYNVKQGQLRPTHILIVIALLLAPAWTLGLQFYQSLATANQIQGLVVTDGSHG